MYPKLPKSFFLVDDVVSRARTLLGCRLWTRINGAVTAGVIVETEAYDGRSDRASHAYGGRRTPRTTVFYREGGIAYTYLCYGIHTLFNVITGPEEVPHAVLVRAIRPCEGIDTILKRRNQSAVRRNTGGGPGLVSQALGITTELNGTDLGGEMIWITRGDREEQPSAENVIASRRVGIDYAGPDAHLPWRFRIKNSVHTSPAR
ncbi:MAG: DNA-3-methyladenine glycosylase [Cyclonatronaceae bacterium]